MDHLAALTWAHHDILEETKETTSKEELDIADLSNASTSSDSSDSDIESEAGWYEKDQTDALKEKLNISGSEPDEAYRLNGARRLNAFILCTQDEGQGDSPMKSD